MDSDELPTSRPGDLLAQAVRQDLDPLSVAELEARIAVLEGEIVRTRAKLDQATRHRSVAEGLFKR